MAQCVRSEGFWKSEIASDISDGALKYSGIKPFALFTDEER